LEAGYAYKVTDVQHGDEMTQRVQSAVYMMYLDLLADCDLTHVNYFLDTLDSAESRVSRSILAVLSLTRVTVVLRAVL
jgi:hypothetical protein